MPQGVSSLVAEISRGKTTVLKEGSITFFPQFLLIIQSTLFASFTCSVRPPNWSSICFLPSCIVWSWSALFISMMLYFSWTIQHYKIYTCHRFQFFALSVHNLSWVLVLCFKLVYLFNWSWKVDSFIVYAIVSASVGQMFVHDVAHDLLRLHIWSDNPNKILSMTGGPQFHHLLGQCILQILLIFLLRLIFQETRNTFFYLKWWSILLDYHLSVNVFFKSPQNTIVGNFYCKIEP